MATRALFFDSIDGDRQYSAENWAHIFAGLASDGIVEADGLVAEPFVGFQVRVGLGRAWLQGRFFQVDSSPEVVPLESSDTQDRIDRIVVRLDTDDRTIELVSKTGTPGAVPSPPALTRSGPVFELSLARVVVPGNSIAPSAVIDEREDINVAGFSKMRVEPFNAAHRIVDTVEELNDIDTTESRLAFIRPTGTYAVYDASQDEWLRFTPADTDQLRDEFLSTLAEIHLRLWQAEANAISATEGMTGWHGDAFLTNQSAIERRMGVGVMNRNARLHLGRFRFDNVRSYLLTAGRSVGNDGYTLRDASDGTILLDNAGGDGTIEDAEMNPRGDALHYATVTNNRVNHRTLTGSGSAQNTAGTSGNTPCFAFSRDGSMLVTADTAPRLYMNTRALTASGSAAHTQLWSALSGWPANITNIIDAAFSNDNEHFYIAEGSTNTTKIVKYSTEGSPITLGPVWQVLSLGGNPRGVVVPPGRDDLVILITTTGIYGLRASDGSVEWEVLGGSRPTMQHKWDADDTHLYAGLVNTSLGGTITRSPAAINYHTGAITWRTETNDVGAHIQYTTVVGDVVHANQRGASAIRRYNKHTGVFIDEWTGYAGNLRHTAGFEMPERSYVETTVSQLPHECNHVMVMAGVADQHPDVEPFIKVRLNQAAEWEEVPASQFGQLVPIGTAGDTLQLQAGLKGTKGIPIETTVLAELQWFVGYATNILQPS